MLRLVLSDLLTHARTWLGVVVVAAATAVVAAVAASDIETAAALGGMPGLALYAISGTVVLLTTVAALVVLGSVADLTVVLQRREHALWQLVGVPPALVRVVVVVQLGLAALIGALLGCSISLPLLQPVYDYLFTGVAGLDGVAVRFGPLGFAGVVVAVTTVVLLSGHRSARRAGRVPVLAVLAEPDPPTTRMGPLRWCGAVLLLAVLTSVLLGLPDRPPQQLEPPLVLVAATVASLLVCLGPLVVPLVLRGWTSLLPPGASASWFLARAGASSSAGRSTAATSPLLLAIALAGGVYSAHGTAAAAAAGAGAGTPLPTQGVVLLLGGPLLLSVLGAVMTVFVSGRVRDRETALVLATGATPGVVVAVALWEAVIHVVTAALLATVPLLATGVAGAWAAGTLGTGGLSLGLVPAAVVAAAELLLLAAATLASTALALRTPVPTALTAE